ncbi:MAG TPA: hypothetical protein VE307_01220 [Nitrososphaeraceae archaeon]|nr:hypothetical protein [Nitrososphaeraceae archaeon]
MFIFLTLLLYDSFKTSSSYKKFHPLNSILTHLNFGGDKQSSWALNIL